MNIFDTLQARYQQLWGVRKCTNTRPSSTLRLLKQVISCSPFIKVSRSKTENGGVFRSVQHAEDYIGTANQDTISQGWRIKRAVKIKRFWSDDVRLQGHFSRFSGRVCHEILITCFLLLFILYVEPCIMLWSERHSCWRGEFGHSDHPF